MLPGSAAVPSRLVLRAALESEGGCCKDESRLTGARGSIEFETLVGWVLVSTPYSDWRTAKSNREDMEDEIRVRRESRGLQDTPEPVQRGSERCGIS